MAVQEFGPQEPKLPSEDIVRISAEVMQQKKNWLNGLQAFRQVTSPDFWTDEGNKSVTFSHDRLGYRVMHTLRQEHESLEIFRDLDEARRNPQEETEVIMLGTEYIVYRTYGPRKKSYRLRAMLPVQNIRDTATAVEKARNF